MKLGYPINDVVLGLKGQKLRLGLGLTAIRRGFELCECLLVSRYLRYANRGSYCYANSYMLPTLLQRIKTVHRHSQSAVTFCAVSVILIF